MNEKDDGHVFQRMLDKLAEEHGMEKETTEEKYIVGLTDHTKKKIGQTLKDINALLNESGLAPEEQIICVFIALQLMQKHFGIDISGMAAVPLKK